VEGTVVRAEPGAGDVGDALRPRLHALAAAGNSVALLLLILALALGPRLSGDRAGFQPPPSPPSGPARAQRVLLVVIDGLRADHAFDATLMPQLAGLAHRGSTGTALVESLIPSTIAGIRTLAEGEVPPPASFLQDFGASPAPSGGIFAAARAAGLRTFAAGPRLWADLYGSWLDGSLAVRTVSGEDHRVLAAGAAALAGGRYGLVVVHLSEPDDAAHLHGARSPEHRQALTRADAALGRLLSLAGAGTAVVVTSDHGVTGSGGHAGPEPAVVRTPLVVAGPGLPRGRFGAVRQSGVAALVLAPLGLPAPPVQPAERGTGWPVPLLALLAAGACLLLWRAVAQGEIHRRAPFLLNATLWLSLAAAALGLHRLALAASLASLGWVAMAVRSGRRGSLPWAAFAAGGLFGLLRLGEAWASATSGDLSAGGPAVLILAVLAGLGLGALLGRRLLPRAPLLCGMLCGIAPAVLARGLGETASLSTLDVRLAFALADGPLGLPGAVAAAALRQALPALAVVFGLAAAFARSPQAGAFAAGLAAVLAGQAVAAALVLAGSAGYPAAGSLSLGLLVRLVGETNALFLGAALAAAVPALVRRGAGRPAPPAATPP